MLQASQNTITFPGGPCCRRQCSQSANCSRPRYTFALILGCFLTAGLDFDGFRDARLVAGLAFDDVGRVIGIGFWVCRPDRVCDEADGLYSGVDSLDRASSLSSPSSTLITSESARFLLPATVRAGADRDGVETVSPVSVTSRDRADFRGPRLMPGRPRPKPLPLTTEPSGMTYRFFSLPFPFGSSGS